MVFKMGIPSWINGGGLPESGRGSNRELKDSMNYGEQQLQSNKLRLIIRQT